MTHLSPILALVTQNRMKKCNDICSDFEMLMIILTGSDGDDDVGW